MNIAEIMAKAKAESAKDFERMLNMRDKMTIEDFKKLFLIRAQQTMTERKNFAEFKVDENNKEIINMMYRYIVRSNCELNPHVGIILNGKYGCGKSVLIDTFCKVLNDLTPNTKNKIQIIHAIELVDEIRLKGVIPFSTKPLCIQDLGKEKECINDFGTKYKPISELLAIRAENGAITFGSTNFDINDFSLFYDGYIGKRIKEHVNLVMLPGTSRRPDYSINQPNANG